ncbi:hypothetical protein [Hymenobacter coccineus]|uniref:hypothetical protein n=1 Tax=Hymenobacter coccineus TaxID=1908235 RepID=UPI000A409628|nr:hypothetical protein [Hymenobacter coccineus]
MKKLILLAAGVATLGLGSCSQGKCPAYTSTKAANRVSSPVMASAATPSARQ